MPKIRRLEPDAHTYMFLCPGCGYGHWFCTEGSPRWHFNGDSDSPTILGQMLVMPKAPLVSRAAGAVSGRCRLTIARGMITFALDCWHELAGQTVALPDAPVDLGMVPELV